MDGRTALAGYLVLLGTAPSRRPGWPGQPDGTTPQTPASQAVTRRPEPQ